MQNKKLPALFYLIRKKDPTGISGTGKVLDGVIFSNGQVVVCWREADESSNPNAHSSIGIYNSFDDFKDIHVKNNADYSEIIIVDLQNESKY